MASKCLTVAEALAFIEGADVPFVHGRTYGEVYALVRQSGGAKGSARLPPKSVRLGAPGAVDALSLPDLRRVLGMSTWDVMRESGIIDEADVRRYEADPGCVSGYARKRLVDKVLPTFYSNLRERLREMVAAAYARGDTRL